MGPERSKAVDSQAQANRSTRDHWRYFAPHRAQIQGLILPDVGKVRHGGRSLCVLGAGNCNDVDLKALTEAFEEVHLVDLDAPALEAAVERQGVKESPRMKLHGGIDHEKLTYRYQGRDFRLTDVEGHVVKEILS